MDNFSLSNSCPSCDEQLTPVRSTCKNCKLSIDAAVKCSEFFYLNEDELHFLRVFIHSEGRIKDMEKILGISYPTVKSQINNLKKRLDLDIEDTVKAKIGDISDDSSNKDELNAKDLSEDLHAFEKGQINYSTLLNNIMRKQ